MTVLRDDSKSLFANVSETALETNFEAVISWELSTATGGAWVPLEPEHLQNAGVVWVQAKSPPASTGDSETVSTWAVGQHDFAGALSISPDSQEQSDWA